MDIPVLGGDGKKVDTKSMEDAVEVLNRRPNTHLIKEAVRLYLARKRRGTASTKGRSDVRFSKRKPWRQKGTGNARAGKASSPIWRTGGVVFGPKPRDFSIDMPKKVRRRALQDALVVRFRDGAVSVCDALKEMSAPKTKEVKKFLVCADLDKKSVLFVTKNVQENLGLSVRNIPRCDICRAADISVYDVVRYEILIVETEAVEVLKDKLTGDNVASKRKAVAR